MNSDRKPRPYIGVHFKCCNVYIRVYLDRFGRTFSGHCPKCMRRIEIKVGPGGSASRFWTAK
ncbi:MAG TPA: hypothetical protein PLO62_03065 [Candidatus Hydrogenedentes bacterium]|nr:hypothetical protein [Candidatus Hydrogenedentota bacterium]HOS03996.1 hypothetical protein [Candidatus Hydrogenedentota bacterium]